MTDAAHGITAYGRGAMMIKLRRYQKCVQSGPGSPRGHLADEDTVGGIVVHQHSPPIQLMFGTQDIHRSGRCS